MTKKLKHWECEEMRLKRDHEKKLVNELSKFLTSRKVRRFE